MPSDPNIRASDQDRDRTAALLREHHAAGRLTLEEFNERLDRVYAAKTMGELDALMADLPAIDLYQLPDASLRRVRGGGVRGGGVRGGGTGGGGTRGGGNSRLPWPHPPGALMATHGSFSPAWRAAWGSWLSVSSICFFVWLVTGGSLTNPWFLWVVGPWGLLMLGRWITGVPGHDHGSDGGDAPGFDRHHGGAPGPDAGGAPGPDAGRGRGRDRDPGRDRNRGRSGGRDRYRGRDHHRGRDYGRGHRGEAGPS
jgi:Domain of unknown function (DUF1707)